MKKSLTVIKTARICLNLPEMFVFSIVICKDTGSFYNLIVKLIKREIITKMKKNQRKKEKE